MLKKVFLIVGSVFLAAGLSLLIFFPDQSSSKILSPLSGRSQRPTEKPKPLEKYYFENLRERSYPGSEVNLEKQLAFREGNPASIPGVYTYTSWLFSFISDGKKVTGMANIPNKEGKMPVVVMLRGYADDEIYFTGLGTRKAAGVLAENGFITLAPDFLGFGSSDSPPEDVLEARFTRPITVLNLIASIKSLPQADEERLFLWGHSNGGQIALSVLEISQRNIPTTLWAPVTMAFPRSVLNYMDDYENLDELGKQVYNRIREFSQNYEPEKVSIAAYFQDIQAPIQVHQGGSDYLVKEEQTDQFVQKMRDLNKEITYFTYPKSDHNLKEDWDEVVKRDIEFFKNY